MKMSEVFTDLNKSIDYNESILPQLTPEQIMLITTAVGLAAFWGTDKLKTMFKLEEISKKLYDIFDDNNYDKFLKSVNNNKDYSPQYKGKILKNIKEIKKDYDDVVKKVKDPEKRIIEFQALLDKNLEV